MMFKNSKGTVFYGIHMYPGLAEYRPEGKDPFRVFLNESTIRDMDKTFAGRPVYVEHVDGVEENLDELREDADGWVIDSFYNKADGKHWAKFIVVSERGLRAIQRGGRLSNCYEPQKFGQGGLWNGIEYAKEVTQGEYEHLAIVNNPRYEESVIMTPEQFKQYNDEKLLELERIANNKEHPMKFSFFRREKVKNEIDLSEMVVVLPKSKKEVVLNELLADADERLSNSPMNAHPEHYVDMGEGNKMTVNDLVTKHKAMCDELEAMKAKNDDGDVDTTVADAVPMAVNEDDEANAEAEGEELKEKKEKAKNELDEKQRIENAAKEKKKAEAKVKADRLRNAGAGKEPEDARIDLTEDQVARGKSRYGSN